MTTRSSPLPTPPDRPAPDVSAGSSMGMAGLGRAGVEAWLDDVGHELRAPGAYEWWSFDAVDVAGNGVVVALFNGLPFYTPYQRQVARWHRRLGHTRLEMPWPEALAAHYPAAFMGVYQGGRRVSQFLNLYPPGSCERSTDEPEVRIGPNRITLRADGSFGLVMRGYPFEIHGMTVRPRRDQILSATLSFAPTFPGVQHVRQFRPNGPDGAPHRWVLAAPHGRMSGRVQHIAQAESVALLDMPVTAIGYHDHHYGHGALGLHVQRLAWGHLAGEDWTVAWQRTFLPGQASVPTDSVLLFEQGRPPLVIDAPSVQTQQARRTRWLIKYAGRESLHGSDAKGNSVELLLHHESVIESSPFHARLSAAATLTVAGRRQYVGRGITQVLQLRRLGWPVLSDVVLHSVLPIASDDPLWRQ